MTDASALQPNRVPPRSWTSRTTKGTWGGTACGQRTPNGRSSTSTHGLRGVALSTDGRGESGWSGSAFVSLLRIRIGIGRFCVTCACWNTRANANERVMQGKNKELAANEGEWSTVVGWAPERLEHRVKLQEPFPLCFCFCYTFGAAHAGERGD